MKNKKNIITAALIAVLGISAGQAFAEQNSLVQMDVKRSSVTDTVDVTFYTTASTGNTVVTRKSANRYVVLLPNTMSSPSATPNFGGVKDLITDIDVKHVNDGMGGYTKVTFGTTKPVSIKTHMQKTSGLSQEQKDARALIAKNNAIAAKPVAASKPAATPSKPAAAPAKTTPAKALTPAAAVKVTPVNTSKPAAATNTVQKQNKNVNPVKTAQNNQAAPDKKAKESAKTTTATASAYVPKMKFDNNGNRVIDLEPRVNHAVASSPSQIPENVEAETPVAGENTPVAQEMPEEQPVAAETPAENNNSDFPYWILFAGGGVALFCIIFLICDAAKHSADKNKSRLESFYDISAQNLAKRRKKEYYEIINNESSNWQEKYKMFNEKDLKKKTVKPEGAMSYVTDISGLKQPKAADLSKLTPEQTEQISHERIVNAKVRAKMLELENSYNAPAAQKPADSKVQSEDDVILKSFNEIKLKSFSKPMSLKESNRTLISKEKPVSRNTSLKEGRFVKLRNASSTLQDKQTPDAADLINTGNKYLNENKPSAKISKEKEEYMVSSVDEYLSILDNEPPQIQPMPAPKIKTPTAIAMNRSGVSNPITSEKKHRTSPDSKPLQNVSGLVVKSGYNIDPDRGFYVVNLDGASAIVGKIKDNIFVLKKFDHAVEGNIQVRRDDDDIYIVRLGRFKCLVSVEQDKMGTLIEI